MSETKDIAWENMLVIAKEQQQNWYEMLPDWTVYKEEDFQYLKLKIAMAIFGLPEKEFSCDKAATETDKDDITKYFNYSTAHQQIIDHVYEQICEHGKGYEFRNAICYGLLYNICFRLKMNCKTDDADVNTIATPIFKIQKSIWKEQERKKVDRNGKAKTSKTLVETVETWFIDVDGRVYKSWQDYKSDNNLPECTMVLPWDGIYQPDLECLCTEETSSVLLEILDSPACNLLAKACNIADTGSTVVSVVGMAVAGASMFTPVGPVVAGIGVAATGVSGLWTTGRSVHQLVDRGIHEESIKPTNMKALGSWLGVVGGVFGFASSAGTALITKSVQNGKNVGNIAKYACNTATGGSLVVNAAGIGFQGFSIYKKYQEENSVDPQDVIFLVAHVFFFGNAVVNVQFASDLIQSTQGKIIDDFKSNIRSKRMQKAFNRASRQANANNANVIAKNSDVIAFIRTKEQILLKMNPSASTNPRAINVKLENGKLNVSDVLLMDPMKFAHDLSTQNFSLRVSKHYNTELFIKLKDRLESLVEGFYSTMEWISSSVIVQESIDVLKEMLGVTNAVEILSCIFKIAVQLLAQSCTTEMLIVMAVHFVWKYVKAHLKKRESNCTSEDSALIYKIINTMLEHIDTIHPFLQRAFKAYQSNAWQ